MRVLVLLFCCAQRVSETSQSCEPADILVDTAVTWTNLRIVGGDSLPEEWTSLASFPDLERAAGYASGSGRDWQVRVLQAHSMVCVRNDEQAECETLVDRKRLNLCR